MFDTELRRIKDILLEPVVSVAAALHLSPGKITAAGLAFGLIAAGAAAVGQWTPALILWLLNRIADGLDGLVARRSNAVSDSGGYLDIMADFVVYATLPLGAAAGVSAEAAATGAATVTAGSMAPHPWLWPSTAVLLAVFYVNTASWMYAAALIEKRQTVASAQAADKAQTTIAMPRGIIEGAETILFITVLLLFPGYIVPIYITFALLTAATALLRVVQWVQLTGRNQS